MANYLEELLFVYPRRYRRYHAWLGGAAATRLIFFELFRLRRKINVVVAGQPLVVRSCATDLQVAADVFARGAFADLELDAPKVIVDGGANIGASSLYFGARYPEATVYAIEPEPENFELLCENCRSRKNVIPIKAALAGSDGPVTLRGNAGHDYGFSTTRGTGDFAVEVEGICLQSLFVKFGIEHVDLLKSDVEGAERDIMENAEPWLGKVRAICAELHDGARPDASRCFFTATADWPVFRKMGEKYFLGK